MLTTGSPYAQPFVGIAREAGLPVPRYELVADLGATFVVVQELLPGAAPEGVDRSLIEAMLTLNERMQGLLRARPGVREVELHLRASGPGYCLHEPLAGYDHRSARLLAWIREVGAERNTADGVDLVHIDYHPGNILVSDGRISALMDWQGACRGDRLLALVTLRFDLARRAMQALYDAEILRGQADAAAASAWREAAQACRVAGLPWNEAYASWRCAQAHLTDRTSRDAASQALRRAYELATDLRATPLLGEPRVLARATRIPPTAPAEPDPEAVHLMPDLTAREREILKYAIAGQTYPQIAKQLVVSEKTISSHISNMLRKTGTTNRTELTQVVHRLTQRRPSDT